MTWKKKNGRWKRGERKNTVYRVNYKGENQFQKKVSEEFETIRTENQIIYMCIYIYNNFFILKNKTGM